MWSRAFKNGGNVVVSDQAKLNVVSLIKEFNPNSAKPVSGGRYVFRLGSRSVIFKICELKNLKTCRERINQCQTTQQ